MSLFLLNNSPIGRRSQLLDAERRGQLLRRPRAAQHLEAEQVLSESVELRNRGGVPLLQGDQQVSSGTGLGPPIIVRYGPNMLLSCL